MPLIRIELSPPDADLFVKFRKYQEIFKRLIDSEALDIHSGSVTMHFDADNILRKIERNDTLFKQ